MFTLNPVTPTAADLTLYLVERDGGGESRLSLGRDAADREAQDMAAGRGDTITVTPLAQDDAELDALWLVDDVDHVLAAVYGYADMLGIDYEPGRCDSYALLLGVRDAAA